MSTAGAEAPPVAGRLPNDPIVEILTRVPARSIHRFKCVSRGWRDLITNPLHRKRFRQTLQGFFYSDDEFHGGCTDAPSCRRHAHKSFITLPGRSAPLADVDPSFSFLTKQPWVRDDIQLLHSCNGLLLFANGKVSEAYGGLGYIVCNPATKQWVAVPNGLSFPKETLTRLLLDDPAMSPHFHLVQIWQNGYWGQFEVSTYSSETGVWCYRSEQGAGMAMLTFTMGSAIVQGMLRFAIFDMAKSEYLIAGVDREGKTCKSIPLLLPADNKGHAGTALLIGQSQGSLHCVSGHVRREINSPEWCGLSVWVHKVQQETDEWVLKHKVSFYKLFGKTSCRNGHDYSVLAIHPDRNMLFLVQNLPKKLIKYDMDSKKLQDLHTPRSSHGQFTPYAPCFLESSVLANKEEE